MDKARRETDIMLKGIANDLDGIYKTATTEAKKKLNKYFEKYQAEDEELRQQVEDGEIDESEYEDWRFKNVTSGRDWKDTRKEVASEYVKADSEAMDLVNKVTPVIFAINYNYMADKLTNDAKSQGVKSSIPRISTEEFIKKGGKISPNYIPKKSINIPKDQKWNERKINSEILQGIKKGESMDKIADRLQKVTNMDRASAIRNARTRVTSAENGARQATANELAKQGIYTHKIWNAIGDERTRDSHLDIDGEEVPYDEPFSNGLDYPGDPYGDSEEVYNCRCSADYVIRDYADDAGSDYDGYGGDDDDDYYADYDEENIAKSTNDGIINTKISSSGEVLNPMDEREYEHWKTVLEGQGVKVYAMTTGDDYRYMVTQGMEGTYSNNEIRHIGEIPSRGTFLEEMIHWSQSKKYGELDYSNYVERDAREIEAQRKLLKNQENYKLDEHDVSDIKRNLKIWEDSFKKRTGESYDESNYRGNV